MDCHAHWILFFPVSKDSSVRPDPIPFFASSEDSSVDESKEDERVPYTSVYSNGFESFHLKTSKVEELLNK